MPWDWTTPPVFTNDVGQVIGAGDLDVLGNDAALLDALSFRQQPAFDIHNIRPNFTFSSTNPKGDERQSWGSQLKLTGLSQLIFKGYFQKTASEYMEFYVNGASVGTVSTNGNYTVTASLPGSVGDVATWEVIKRGTTTVYGIYRVDLVYSPITLSIPASGSTFSSTFDATRLNALSTQARGLYTAMASVPIMPQVAQVYRNLSGKITTGGNVVGDALPVVQATVMKSYSNEILRFFATVLVMNTTEYYDVYLNGSLAATLGPYSSADSQPRTIYAPISLAGVSVGSTAHVYIAQRVTAGTSTSIPSPTRITIYYLGTHPDSSNYAYAAAPYDWTPHEKTASATLASRLNTIRTVLDTASSRVTASTSPFAKVIAFRKVFAIDPTEASKPKTLSMHPTRFIRQGSRLVVRGRSVSIYWGSFKPGEKDDDVYNAETKKTEKQKVPDYDSAVYSHKETLIGSDKIETRTVFLDAYGIQRGEWYYVRADSGGSVEYAGEFLT